MGKKRHPPRAGAQSSTGPAVPATAALPPVSRRATPRAADLTARALALGCGLWLLLTAVYFSSGELEFLRSKTYPVLAGGACGLGMAALAAWRGRLVLPRTAVDPFMAAWLAVLVASSLAAPLPWTGLRTTAGTAAAVLGFYVAAYAARAGAARLLQGLIAVTGAVVAVIALLQAGGFKPLGVTSASVAEVALQGASAQYVAFSTLGHKNLVASFCLMCAGAAGGLALGGGSRVERLSWAGVTAILAAGVAVAHSRTGWAAGGVLLVVAAGGWILGRRLVDREIRISGRTLKVVAGLALMGVVAATVLLVAAPGLARPLIERLTIERLWGLFNNRGVHWIVAVLTALDHPLLGAGPGHFGHAYSTYLLKALGWVSDPYKGGTQANQAHSDPLHIAAETGFLGLVVYLLLWGAVALAMARAWRAAAGAQRARVGGLALGVLAFHLTGLLDFPASSGPHVLVVWAMAGLALGSDAGGLSAMPGVKGRRPAHANPSEAGAVHEYAGASPVSSWRTIDIPRPARIPLALLLSSLMVLGLWRVLEFRSADRDTVAGRAAYRKGDMAEAKVRLERAIASDDQIAEPFFWRGRIAHREGALADARRYLDRSRALWPHYAVDLASGVLALDQRRPADASEALGRYLRIRPMSAPREYDLLVRARTAAGDTRGAEAIRSMADPEKRLEMGRQVEAEGKPGEAFEWYISRDDDVGYLAAIRASIAAGEPSRGRAVLARIQSSSVRAEGTRLLEAVGP